MNTERLSAFGLTAIKMRRECGSESRQYKAAMREIVEEEKRLKIQYPEKFWQASDLTYQEMCKQWAQSRELRSLMHPQVQA